MISDDIRDELNSLMTQIGVTVRVNLPRVEDLEMCSREVLWYLDGDHENGIEPGGFHKALIDAMTRADEDNLSQLALAFPAMAGVVNTYKSHPDGVDILRTMARGPKGDFS